MRPAPRTLSERGGVQLSLGTPIAYVRFLPKADIQPKLPVIINSPPACLSPRPSASLATMAGRVRR